MKCLTLFSLHFSIKLQNPTRLDCTYALGFSIENLTPAWAAKFITISMLSLHTTEHYISFIYDTYETWLNTYPS